MILCSERLPKSSDIRTARRYITRSAEGVISALEYADGWNNFVRVTDGETDRSHEITDIVAWDYIPAPDDERWRTGVKPPQPKRMEDNTFYLTLDRHGYHTTMMYADGWNCLVNADGTIFKDYEVHDVVAWMPLTEFDIPCSLCTEDCAIKED